MPACNSNAFTMQCNGRCFSACDERVFSGEAFNRCVALGGFVASPHDQAEFDCVVQLRGNIALDAWTGWVQLSNQAAPATGWGWQDGINTFVPTWSVLEPEDLDGVEDNMEQCSVMYMNGLFADVSCGSSLPFVCSI